MKRYCLNCGREFLAKPSRQHFKFCSFACRSSGSRTIKQCPTCHSFFSIVRSRMAHQTYCSWECRYRKNWTFKRGSCTYCRSCGRRWNLCPPSECSSSQHRDYWKHELRQRSKLGRMMRWKAKLLVLSMLGRKCVKCGITDPRVLGLNHKNPGGLKDRRRFRDQQHGLYRAILKGERDSADLEIRCLNCNALYEYERGRCSLPPNWATTVNGRAQDGLRSRSDFTTPNSQRAFDPAARVPLSTRTTDNEPNILSG